MNIPHPPPRPEDLELFKKLIDENRYDFCKLAYIIFGFGEPNHPLEFKSPYQWQWQEWENLSKHLKNPETRYETYRFGCSSGNGAAKTAFGAMTIIMLMYTQRLRARITANTDPQMKQVVWPEYDKWYRLARFHEHFFEKFGTSIKARNPDLADTWRTDTVNWSEESPAAISGLHNEGFAVAYVFEEAPGIPAKIYEYASGAFTEKNTIKLHFAFGNSDDPNSKFEQNMSSPNWRSLRIDTRTLDHIDPKQIAAWLIDAGGDEDHDDFRVRVRGLPRKTAKDSVIRREEVDAALLLGEKFDVRSVHHLPCVLGCDPAWQGGDETVIWYRQGNYKCLLERYKLDRTENENHLLTYQKLCRWEKAIQADAVNIDQGEGTAIYGYAINAGKMSWYLINFASSPNDTAESKDSEYANMRAMMAYKARDWLRQNGAIGIHEDFVGEVREKTIKDIIMQLTATKGTKHKVTGKRLLQPKDEVKDLIGCSPDLFDGFILTEAHPIIDRLPENEKGGSSEDGIHIGENPLRMPEHESPYDEDITDVEYRELYDN